jgi:hypothetical protein
MLKADTRSRKAMMLSIKSRALAQVVVVNLEVTTAKLTYRAQRIVGGDNPDLQLFDDRSDLQAYLRGLRVPTAIPIMFLTLFVPICYGTLTDLGERWANPRRTTPDWQPTDSA